MPLYQREQKNGFLGDWWMEKLDKVKKLVERRYLEEMDGL